MPGSPGLHGLTASSTNSSCRSENTVARHVQILNNGNWMMAMLRVKTWPPLPLPESLAQGVLPSPLLSPSWQTLGEPATAARAASREAQTSRKGILGTVSKNLSSFQLPLEDATSHVSPDLKNAVLSSFDFYCKYSGQSRSAPGCPGSPGLWAFTSPAPNQCQFLLPEHWRKTMQCSPSLAGVVLDNDWWVGHCEPPRVGGTLLRSHWALVIEPAQT